MVRLPALLPLLAFVAACSPINLESAVSLGNAGVKTASTYQQAVGALSPGLNNFLQGQYMLAALDPHKYSAPDTSLIASITQIQAALAARDLLLGQLVKVYNQFLALASYDASAQVKSSLADFDGAINNYAKALGESSPPIAPQANAAISDVGGLIAYQIQKRQVLKASEAIVSRLNAVSGLLATEIMNYNNLQDEIVRGLRDTTVSLWQHGIGSPDKIISDQMGGFGLTYISGSYSRACLNLSGAARVLCQRQFNYAVDTAIKYRAARLATDQAQAMTSNQTALQALVASHKQLQQGKPLDLTAITTELAAIQGVISDINQAKNAGGKN